jgi:hypothetical protein
VAALHLGLPFLAFRKLEPSEQLCRLAAALAFNLSEVGLEKSIFHLLVGKFMSHTRLDAHRVQKIRIFQYPP